MAKTVTIEVKDRDLVAAIAGFLKRVLEKGAVDAVLAPWRLPMKNMVMPTLITDPQQVSRVDPLSPAFPMNGARILSRLTRKASGSRLAAVMRPCEIRAFVELVKLNQGSTEDLLIIGVDCLGALRNTDYFQWAQDDAGEATKRYVDGVLGGAAPAGGREPARACTVCEMPVPDGADVALCLYGTDTEKGIAATGQTPGGEALLGRLGLAAAQEPPGRQKAVEQLVAERRARRDAMFEETLQATDDLEKLTRYLGNCVNCYNCRVACPVCYCRECVFVTDVFDHDPAQYLRWARRKGAVKMPTDTVFYHLTRLAHMSTACVGCGQCSNACPNDIPVMELFRTIAHRTQEGFGYRAGRSLDEKPPLTEFREEEFTEVVGIG